jgi:adenylate cyclase
LQRAVELGKKAITLDDSNSYTHGSIVFPYVMLGEYEKAISEAEKGLSLDPNSAGSYYALGTALLSAGRPQEAIPMIQKSLRLSPIPIHNEVLGILARSHSALGQYEEAVATYKKMLQLYGPDHISAHIWLALTYVLMDHEMEARTEGAEVLRIDPKFSFELWVRGMPLDQLRKDGWIKLLRKAGLN